MRLESSLYMRNQLLRDADWAGMAQSLEIQVPLVDFTAMSALACAIPALPPGAGKAALASAPRLPLPNEILQRSKTGFCVPTAAWTARTRSTRSSMKESRRALHRDAGRARCSRRSMHLAEQSLCDSVRLPCWHW